MRRNWLGFSNKMLVIFAFVFIAITLFMTEALADPDKGKVLEPSVSFVGRGPVVPLSSDQSIPISAVNVNEIDVDILQANNPASFLNQYYFNQEIKAWDLSSIERSFTSLHIDRYTLPKARTNEEQTVRIRIPQSIKPGWYLVVVRKAGSYDNLQVRHVLLTDIGVQAKVFHNSITVRTASLSSGYAFTSGVVKLYRKDGNLFESAAIDNEGKAVLNVTPENNDVIVVESGKSYSILPLREIPLDLSEYSIGGRVAQAESAFVYSNRDLIRPGNSIPINILLRDAQGDRMLNIPLTLTLFDSKNKQILSKLVNASESGYYRYDIESQPFWNVGRYTLEVRTDSTSKNPVNVFRFQVEEFTPERMELTVTPKQETVYADDEVQYDLSGRYLFGSPANNNQLKTFVSYGPVYSFSGKYKDFLVGKKHNLEDRYKRLDDTRLSEKGKATVLVTTPASNKIYSPIKVESEFSLLESGGAAVQRKHSVVVWKKSAIPAVRPHKKVFDYRSQAEFDIALLNDSGSQMLDGSLQIQLDYDQGKHYWIYEEGRGWRKKTQDKWKTIVEKPLSVKKGQSTLLSVPVTWGNYRLTVTDKKSGNVTEYEFYAGWNESRQQIQAKPDHLAVTLDKTHYKVGELIKVNVRAPVRGDLTVTVESDKELYSKTITVEKGQQSLDIPMENDWNRHDMYVSAVLTSNVNGQPIRYMGVEALKLNRTERELQVDVELPEVIKAEKTVIIPVKVAGGKSDKQKTWVTLSLVDKGILNLSRFKPSDPYHYFYAQQRYNPDVIDLYSRLYDLRPDPFATSRFGSDMMSSETEEAAMAALNKNESLVEVKTLTLMSKPVEVKNGVANVTLDIPDYNGEVQVIATAFNDNEFGQQVVDNKVTHKVVAELSIPKFFAPGDNSSMTVELFNVSGVKQQFNVSLSTSNDALKFVEPFNEVITLEDKQRYYATLPVTAAEHFKFRSSTVSLALSSVESSDSEAVNIQRQWYVPIRPSVPYVTRTMSATIQPGQTFEVPQSMWKGLTWLDGSAGTMTVSYSPQVDIQKQANALFGYPYGCTEQTISKAMPYLYDLPKLEEIKQEQLEKAEKTEEQLLEQVVQRLLVRQLSYGAFSLWDNGREDAWITVYATDFLIKVNNKYPDIVPKQAIESALKRVRYYVTRKVSTVEHVSAFTYASYVLAQNGQLNWSDLNKVWQQNRHNFYTSKHEFMQLAAAYALVGNSSHAEEMLNQWETVEFNASRVSRGNFRRYASPMRDNALSAAILDDLIEHSKVNARYTSIRNKLLFSAITESYKKRWFSTQENNALLMAAMVSSREDRKTLVGDIDGQEFTAIGSYFDKVSPQTVVKNTSREPIMVFVNAQGYPDQGSLTSGYIHSDSNVLAKTVRYMDGRAYNGEPVKVGDRLVVDIAIQLSKALRDDDGETIYLTDVLLEDLTPSGFAVENPALNQGPDVKTVLGSSLKDYPLTEANHQEFRNDRYVAAFDGVFLRRKLRFAYVVRAEVSGDYIWPATKVEAMYNPAQRIMLKPNVGKVTVSTQAKADQ
ncbi:MAG: alpha-2-macroglobulin family protein [Vibrio sp.]|uniref:alpha-2-macroglobulin family protein n=1 Tax=Vibrio sp. TaxID=678 RepID=UPI003A8A464C